MYGIFNYIWVFLGQMLVNIPYMEHMGRFTNKSPIVTVIEH